MSTMIQIRNVPDELHRRVKARAALAGLSMSDYILGELEAMMARPTRQELLARLASLPPIELHPPAAEVIRAERDRR